MWKIIESLKLNRKNGTLITELKLNALQAKHWQEQLRWSKLHFSANKPKINSVNLVTGLNNNCKGMLLCPLNWFLCCIITEYSSHIRNKNLQLYTDIGITRIFDWREVPNRKPHAMTSSEIFEKRDFLWDKDTAKWRIRSRDLVWHVTRILLKGEDLNQTLKISVTQMYQIVCNFLEK